VGLKVNAEKLTFCALEIEYLGYILTRGCIKPQTRVIRCRQYLGFNRPHMSNNSGIS
jgi:hypothetical protein